MYMIIYNFGFQPLDKILIIHRLVKCRKDNTALFFQFFVLLND